MKSDNKMVSASKVKNATAGRVKESVKNMNSRPAGRTSYTAGCKNASTNAK